MGEHKDDEKDLCPQHPIASLSLGQPRDFVFKHQDCRGKNAKRCIDTVKLLLENGSLLLMNFPTNRFWFHSLPKRIKVMGPRINMTFRKMLPSNCKPIPSTNIKQEEGESSKWLNKGALFQAGRKGIRNSLAILFLSSGDPEKLILLLFLSVLSDN